MQVIHKFLHFATWAGFVAKRDGAGAGIDSDSSIAFVRDQRAISTHGTEYYCGEKPLGALAYKEGMSFSELSVKPKTLAGYGITDAVSKFGGEMSGKLSVTGSDENNVSIYADSDISTEGLVVHDVASISNATVGSLEATTAKVSGELTCLKLTQTSDRRAKTDIGDVPDDFVERLFETDNGLIRTFAYRDTGQRANGVIAQEIAGLIPEAVAYDSASDTYRVDYASALSKIVGALFRRVKRLEAELGGLEREARAEGAETR